MPINFGTFGRVDYCHVKDEWTFQNGSDPLIPTLLQSYPYPLYLDKAIWPSWKPFGKKRPSSTVEMLDDQLAWEYSKQLGTIDLEQESRFEQRYMRLDRIRNRLQLVPFGESLLVAHPGADASQIVFSQILPWWSEQGILPKYQHVPNDYCQWDCFGLPIRQINHCSRAKSVLTSTDSSLHLFKVDPDEYDDVMLANQYHNSTQACIDSFQSTTIYNDDQIAVCTEDGSVYLWCLENERNLLIPLVSTKSDLYSLSYRADGQVVYAASSRGLYSIDPRQAPLATTEQLSEYLVNVPHIGSIISLAAHPTNIQFVACTFENEYKDNNPNSIGIAWFDHRNYKRPCLEWSSELFANQTMVIDAILDDSIYARSIGEGQSGNFGMDRGNVLFSIPARLDGQTGIKSYAPTLPFRLSSPSFNPISVSIATPSSLFNPLDSLVSIGFDIKNLSNLSGFPCNQFNGYLSVSMYEQQQQQELPLQKDGGSKCNSFSFQYHLINEPADRYIEFFGPDTLESTIQSQRQPFSQNVGANSLFNPFEMLDLTNLKEPLNKLDPEQLQNWNIFECTDPQVLSRLNLPTTKPANLPCILIQATNTIPSHDNFDVLPDALTTAAKILAKKWEELA